MPIPRTLVAWWLAATVSLNVGFARSPEARPEGETVRIRATADAWLGDTPEERNAAGSHRAGKLKGTEQMALFRFDTSELVGREVLGATLLLHRAGPDQLRYLRVSTVNQNWGGGRVVADNVTFQWAEAGIKEPRAWAWPGSTVADVIMSAGNSLGCWAERMEMDNGWIAVVVPPQLVYALAVGDSDGLAVMEGGTPNQHANAISAVRSRGSGPQLEVRLGGQLNATPAQPVVSAEPAKERASLAGGAIKLSIEPDPQVFCWRVRLAGRPVERWRVKHPSLSGHTVFYLEDLPPSQELAVEITAVASSGNASAPARLSVTSSPAARRIELGPLQEPPSSAGSVREDGALKVWALPGLVKLSPVANQLMCDDLGSPDETTTPDVQCNAVWDGRRIRLVAARGEYVSYQLCVVNRREQPLRELRVQPQPLAGEQAKIGLENIELYQTWYAKNGRDNWQPAYHVPIAPTTVMTIPQYPDRLPEQQNQTIHVDVYVPKQLAPGRYTGLVRVAAEEELQVDIPVELEVLRFALPDRLTFWPELNAYRIPEPAHDYYRLAHQHRCVLNCYAWRPKLSGSGAAIKIDWEEYDRQVGPLLTGEAFADNRRSGVPVESMYLPFDSSWPTPLSGETYAYTGHWPSKGESLEHVVAHYLNGPYIANGLSAEYRAAFLAVQRQFIRHFARMGYNQTEMQCFFGGKATHRIEYGSNKWWTTDEPQYWDDWMALQFFLHLWAGGRGDADPRMWAARADISRPQWQGRTLNGVVDCAYYGAEGTRGPAMAHRRRTLGQETGLNSRVYGAASGETASALDNVAAVVSAWADGADAYLPCQTLGNEKSLERVDAGADSGSALLVPGDRFGVPVLADIRLKAFRDGQQLVEYLNLLADRDHLSREQIKAAIFEALHPSPAAKPVQDADSLELGSISAWQLAELRRRIAERLVK